MRDEPDNVADEPYASGVWAAIERALVDGTLSTEQLEAAIATGEPMPSYVRIALDDQLTQPFLDNSKRSSRTVAAARAWANHRAGKTLWVDAVTDAAFRVNTSESTIARILRKLGLTMRSRG